VGSNPTPSASILFSVVRHRSESTTNSTACLCTAALANVLSNQSANRSFCPWVRRTVFHWKKHMAGGLKPLNVEREEKPGKYADGDGLYAPLTVTATASRGLQT
jgi:hypothetical protein